MVLLQCWNGVPAAGGLLDGGHGGPTAVLGARESRPSVGVGVEVECGESRPCVWVGVEVGS